MTQAEKVDIIVNKSCEYFGMTKDELATKVAWRQKSKRSSEKRFLCYMLKRNTFLPLERIAEITGYHSHAAVAHHVKEVANEVSGRFGDKHSMKLYKELVDYVALDLI